MELDMPRSLQVDRDASRKAVNPSPMGLLLIISNLDGLAIAKKQESSWLVLAS
jgi:hypothetical protein